MYSYRTKPVKTSKNIDLTKRRDLKPEFHLISCFAGFQVFNIPQAFCHRWSTTTPTTTQLPTQFLDVSHRRHLAGRPISKATKQK